MAFVVCYIFVFYVQWKNDIEMIILCQDAVEIVRNTDRVFLLDQNWKLQIRRADISDTARYSCKATNVAGVAEKYFDLNVLGMLDYKNKKCFHTFDY